MKIRKDLLPLLIISLVVTPAAWAAQKPSPAQYKSRADENMVKAGRLAEGADALIRKQAGRDGLQQALAAYAEAGRLFEEANRLYKDTNANQALIDQSKKAMDYCIEMMKKAKKYAG